MAAHLGVGLTAVNNAVHRGAFPSNWFFCLKDLCDEAGIDCPKELFGFRLPSGPQDVKSETTSQEDSSVEDGSARHGMAQ
jgi:hypothetical protein